MSIPVKNDILYFNNKPIFKYLDIVNIRKKNIIEVLDGNIKAKYNGKIVQGIMNCAPKKGWYKIQLIELL